MIRKFTKEELLEQDTKVLKMLNRTGQPGFITLEKVTNKESDPNPNNIRLIDVNYYNIVVDTRGFVKDPLMIQSIYLGEESLKLFIVPEYNHIKARIEENKLNDITIEWRDIEYERNLKLENLGI